MYIFFNKFLIDIWPSTIIVSYIQSLTVLRSSSCSASSCYLMAHINNNDSNGNRYSGGTISGHPKRHLLTTGWKDIVNAKKLVPGEAFVFLKGGKWRALCWSKKAYESFKLYSIICDIKSNSSCHPCYFLLWLHISQELVHLHSSSALTNTLEAQSYRFSVGMKFELKFDGEESLERRFSVGMKFELKFDGEESLEQRFSRTIVGIGETGSSKLRNF